MSCVRPLYADSSVEGPPRFLSGREYESYDRRLREGVVDARISAFPCGKCVSCRLERSKMWALRIMHEAMEHDESCFITLTYDDAHLSYGDYPTLVDQDLTLWLKRVRKRVGPIRYFAAGEYGGINGRPHYHAIIFGWKPKFGYQATASTYSSPEVDALWSLGNSTVGQLTPASAAYTAQYCMKKVYGKADRERGRAGEFVRMSLKPGIGAKWADRFEGDFEHGYMVSGGRKLRVPRYYKERRGARDPEWLELMERRTGEFMSAIPPAELTSERLLVKEEMVLSRRNFFARNRDAEERKS